MYRREKLLFALLVVFGLSALLGGCVGVKEKFLGVAERAPGLDPDPRFSLEPRVGEISSPLLACGLREVSPKEAGIDSEALGKDSQIMALRERLERRGLKPILGALRLFASQSVKLGLLPFGTEAGIAFEERAGQLNAVALIKQENGTLTIYPDGREELWALLSQHAVQNLVEQLRKDEAFLAFEKELASQGKQINTAQSLGATTADKGLLYLAVGESQGLTLGPPVSYYRMELSVSDKGSYRVQGRPLEICAVSKDDIKTLGFPEGTIMHVIGVYEASAGDKLELQVVRPTRGPCVLGLGALACLDWPCFAEKKVENPYYIKDLLTTLKNSPEYREIQGQLLSDVPEDVWYIEIAEDLRLVAITFTLKKDIKASSQDHFVIYPSVVYYIDPNTKQVVEIVLRQIDEEKLDEVQLVFLKHPENNRTIKLDKGVTEQFRAAKQKVTRQIMQPAGPGNGGRGPTVMCWLVRREGRVNRTCKNLCIAACGAAVCVSLPARLGPACGVACNEFCDWMCVEGDIGVECTVWDAQFTPMAREGGSPRP